MKKATLFGIVITTLAYTAVASAGYFAFGNDVPANILTGFGFFNPFWLVDAANVAVVIHLVGAYQVSTLSSINSSPDSFSFHRSAT